MERAKAFTLGSRRKWLMHAVPLDYSVNDKWCNYWAPGLTCCLVHDLRPRLRFLRRISLRPERYTPC